MRKKTIVIIATTIAVFILSLIALIMLREQPWPHDVVWSTQRLTSDQAEELSDILISLERELKSNMNNKGGDSPHDIINIRFKPSLEKEYGYMLKFVDTAAIHDHINMQFLSSLAELANDIDDLSEDGDILISGMIDGDNFVITLESTRSGEMRRVIL